MKNYKQKSYDALPKADSSKKCPFDISIVGADSGSSTVKFNSPGSVYPFGFPQNMWNGNSFFSAPITNDSVNYVKVSGRSDDLNNIVELNIITSNSPAAPIGVTSNKAPENFEVTLYIIISGVAHRTIACNNLNASPEVALVTSRSGSIECAEDPYLRHYTWRIT